MASRGTLSRSGIGHLTATVAHSQDFLQWSGWFTAYREHGVWPRCLIGQLDRLKSVMYSSTASSKHKRLCKQSGLCAQKDPFPFPTVPPFPYQRIWRQGHYTLWSDRWTQYNQLAPLRQTPHALIVKGRIPGTARCFHVPLLYCKSSAFRGKTG